MEKLTEEEFRKKYGKPSSEFRYVTPEELLQARIPVPTPKPQQRRYGAAVPVSEETDPDMLAREQSQDAFLAGPERIPVSKPSTGPVTRRVIPTNEKPYQPSQTLTEGVTGEAATFQDLVNEIDDPAIREDLSQFVAADTQRKITQGAAVEQLAKNAGSGLLQIPAGIPAAVDLVRFGVPAVVRTFANDDPNVGKFKQLANEFVSGILPPEAQQELEADVVAVRDKFIAENPGATHEEVLKAMFAYQDSQEFFDKMTSKMPAGFRMSNYLNDWANKQVDLNKRPDQQTVIDDLEQMFAQSIVGIPSSITKAAGKQLTKVIGEKAANSVATKALARAAEVMTPVTMPYTPTNVAANTAVGATITEASRAISEQPSLLNGMGQQIANTVPPELMPIEGIEPPDGHGTDIGGQIDNGLLASGMTLGAAISFPAWRHQIINQAMTNAQEEAVQGIRSAQDIARRGHDMMTAGPTLEDQSGKMQPQLSPLTGLVDANSPAKKGAQKFKADTDTETVPRIDGAMSSATTTNRIEAENKALNFGILEGIPDTIPFADIDRAARQMDPDTRALLDNYLYARGRKQDYDVNMRSLDAQVREQEIRYNAALARNDNRSASGLKPGLDKLRKELADLKADTPESRGSFVGRSMQEINETIRLGNANQQVKQLADNIEQVSADLLTYMQRNGMISHEEALRMAHARPLYIPLRERTRPDLPDGLMRKAVLFKDRIMNKGESDEAFYTSQIRRNVAGEGVHVNNPMDPLEALKMGIMDAVRTVTANNARRTVIDSLDALPDARGRLLRPYEFNVGHGRKVTSMSDAQFGRWRQENTSFDPSKFIRISRDGRVEFWEFADHNLMKSLQFAPLATVPIFNATRKFWQQMTTGLGAPWFAAKTFFWDVPLAKSTMMQGRSLGLIDTYARKLFGESALVNNILDHTPFTGAWASALSAIPYQMSMRAMRQLATKIEQDLSSNSGVFSALSASPQTRAMLQRASMAMAATFDRSAFNVLQRNLSTSMSHLGELSKIHDGYRKAHSTAVGRSAKSMWAGYVAMIESVQNATRVAFFAENYGRLQSIYNNNIPKSELNKLIQETRNLTGDMSRTSNSPTIQKITSVIPYGNPIIQGTRHLLSAAIPPGIIGAKGINKLGGNMLTDRTNRFWSQFLGGVMLPKLGALAVLSQWEGAEDFWYNKTPEWEQQSFMPLPNPDAIMHYIENGEWPEFHPTMLNKVPISPEFTLLTAPIEAFMRSMGMLGSAKRYIPGGLNKDLEDAFTQVTSFATPPLVQAFAAFNQGRLDLRKGMTGEGFFQEPTDTPVGGANQDGMTFNSDISRMVYDMVGALAGTSSQIAMQSLNVFDIALDEKEGFWNAADKAFDTFKYETARRFPAVDVPGLYKARERQSSFTPESEYVFNAMNSLEPMFQQLQVERDKKGRIETGQASGLETAGSISDPALLSAANEVYNLTNRKGPYKAAAEEYTDMRAMLSQLEATRAKMPADKYHAQRNAYVQAQQKIKATQAKLLVTKENQLKAKYNRYFQRTYGSSFSYKALADAIRSNVRNK